MENVTQSKLLLEWFARFGRDLPWRHKGGAHPDPYIVLVSEIMLQQTTVKTVLSYFERFITRFPNVQALASAPLEEVYLYWQGLGYYTRAKSLHQSAQIICTEFDGRFPSNLEEIKKLKGLGAYSRASFLALSFNLPYTVVDGNVIRIISRLEHLTEPIEQILPQITQKATALTDVLHPADYASAIMDLGATVCTKKSPLCAQCPWQNFCLSKTEPDLEQIPVRQKLQKKVIEGYVFLIVNSKSQICIRQRTEKGLLSGLYEFPWSETNLYPNATQTKYAVSHIFTHINMHLKICLVHSQSAYQNGFFVDPSELQNYPFSTLMQKVASHIKPLL